MAAFTELLRTTGTSLYDGQSLAPDARHRLPSHQECDTNLQKKSC